MRKSRVITLIWKFVQGMGSYSNYIVWSWEWQQARSLDSMLKEKWFNSQNRRMFLRFFSHSSIRRHIQTSTERVSKCSSQWPRQLESTKCPRPQTFVTNDCCTFSWPLLSQSYLRIIGTFYLYTHPKFLSMQLSTIILDWLAPLFLIFLERLLSQFYMDYLRLIRFPGYVGKNKQYEWFIVNLPDQVQYHEAWTSLFKESTHYINSIPRTSGNNCHSSERGAICNTCLASLHALTGQLEEIDTLPTLRNTLWSPDTRFPGSILKCCEDGCCPFVESVTHLWRNKFGEIPSFAKLLGLRE